MAAVSTLQLWLLALVAPGALARLHGKEVHCVQDRAHVLHFDISGDPNDGSSMEGIEQALISLEPSPEHSPLCTGPSGDKKFCYGVNQDASCAAAKVDLPLRAGWDCKDCYASAAADTFYKLNYTVARLNSVELGLRDVHIRTSAAAHRRKGAAELPVNGSLLLPGSNRTYTLIDTKVGCPICVRVKIVVSTPTTLDYKLGWSGRAEVEAGGNLDIHLGDNIVRYERSKGWSHETGKLHVDVGSILTADGHAGLSLQLGLQTTLKVEVDKIMWYHLNLDPALPLSVNSSGPVWPFKRDKVCLDANASFAVSQEADLHWHLALWKIEKHYGPSTLHKWERKDVVHACKELGGGNTTSSALLI